MSKCKKRLLQMQGIYCKCKSKCNLHLPLLQLHIHRDRLRRATATIESAASVHIGIVRLIGMWADSQREGRHHA